MALEAVVFTKAKELFIQNSKELFSMEGGVNNNPWFDFDVGMKEDKDGENGGGGRMENYYEQQKVSFLDELQISWDNIIPSCSSLVNNLDDGWDVNSSPEIPVEDSTGIATVTKAAATSMELSGRKKRRRTKTRKNEEEIENQRMTHIAVERNRRKQMNEYLAVIRSLMPASYVQRGDQASIIGGAINFVKELEQLVQSLEVEKRRVSRSAESSSSTEKNWPFADFFTFPQYSMHSSTSNSSTCRSGCNEAVAENRSALADIEVTMVESHANLKIVSNRRPKQLLKMVVGLQNIRLTALHLNVTTIDEMVLYSFSLKVEDDCKLITVDEIANVVYQILESIEEECGLI